MNIKLSTYVKSMKNIHCLILTYILVELIQCISIVLLTIINIMIFVLFRVNSKSIINMIDFLTNSLIDFSLLSILLFIPTIIFVFKLFYSKFPNEIKKEGNKLVIDKIFSKDVVEIKNISKITEVNFLKKSTIYNIKYEKNTILIHLNAYRDSVEFIEELKKEWNTII